MRLPRHRPAQRGLTLIETMIAMLILTIGILGTMKLQVLGIYADQGARANVRAQELARELAAALTRLDQTDTRLAATSTAATPPTTFGRPLDTTTPALWRSWSDSTPLPGATLDAAIERDPENAALALYKRKWAVWQAPTANTASAVRLVAVSVVYREQRIPTPQAVTLYLQVANPGAAAVNAAAFR